MKTQLRTTGWTVYYDDGTYHATGDNGRWYTWFSKPVARAIAHRIGGWYDRSDTRTIKEVVVEE